MSNSNTLHARVRLDTTQATRALSKFNKLLQQTDSIINKINKDINKIPSQMRRVETSGVKAGKNITKSFIDARHEISGLSNSLSRLLGLYAAFAGVRTMITTSDSITSAQNKLNYLNSELLGEQGVTIDANGNTSYSNATLNATQEQLDKMFASSQKVRSNYTDMMANVSKSMTLAPDAFGGNVDNAIRFQEIMAEAYTLGGASAQEMHSSMYQMIQALGSGILAGDELRSVREGAPLAYKEIEKFAQELYNTETSLKDMASQGMITSDIVVAAMMQAGDSIDSAFAMTNMTFAQAWTVIKNAATKAFEPVFAVLNEFLNSDQGKATIEALISVMEDLATVMLFVVTISTKIIGVIAEHWSTIKPIIYMAITGIMLVVSALMALKIASFIAGIYAQLPWLWLIALIVVVGSIIYTVLNTMLGASATFADGVAKLMMWLGLTILTVIAVIVLAAWAGLISITFGVYLVVLAIMGLLLVLVGVFIKWADVIMGVFYGCVSALSAMWENFKIAWSNILISLQLMFWQWVDGLIQDFKPFLKMVNAALSAMGKDTIDLDFAADKIDGLNGELQSYVNVSEAYRTGYDKGSAIGKGIQDKINGWGENLKNPTDEIANSLNTTDVGTGLGNSGTLGDIADDTSSIADSMALSAEDLEYLRKIAAMEWKKEFTTANITVDMTNYNQIDNDNDLDGIVTQLSKKLYQELGEVANGVYA